MSALPLSPQHDEETRQRAFAAYDILDTPPEASFDRITALAARLLHTPISTITFVDDKRQWFKSAVGLGERESPRELSFCAHAVASDDLLVIPDARSDRRFADNALVTGAPHIRFYAGAPLVVPRFPQSDLESRLTRESARLGTVCVIDTEPRPMGLRPEEGEILRNLAAMVVDAMLHRLAAGHHREEIASRERAEAGWRRSEERYQRLANNRLGVVHQMARSPEGIYSFPLIGEGCREILHVSPAAIRRDANALFRLIVAEDLPPTLESLVQSAATLEPWQWEGRIRTPDDHVVKWLTATSWPQSQPDGTILWDGILTDVTARHAAQAALRDANRDLEARVEERTAALGAEVAERRRAEEAARESRDLATILVDNATDLVFVQDLQDRYLLVNPAFASAYGKRGEEIVGRDSRAVFDEATAKRVAADNRAVVASGATATTEFPAVLADGCTVRSLQTALSPLRDHQGRVTGIIGIARDVTGRKETERQLEAHACRQAVVARLGRRALELSGEDGLAALLREATHLVSSTLNVPYCSVVERDPAGTGARYRAVHGWPEEVVGTSLSTIGFEESGFAYILRHGETINCPDYRTETRFKPAEESRRLGLRATMCVIVAQRTDGPATGEASFMGVLAVHDREIHPWQPEDVTFLQAVANVLAAAIDRHRAEEAVEIARREAETANTAKSEFLSRMSHELRTPLNAILGFGQLLEMDAETIAQQESTEHILRAGRHLLGLIDEVLDIARIESGRLVLESAEVSLGHTIEDAVTLVRQATKGRGVRIEPLDGQAYGHRVHADPMRLRQVLVNLLSNAVKYNVPGGRVGVRVNHPDGGMTVRVEVWDTGRGIPMESIERLFLPFERLGAEHGPEEGTGIGLTIAKRLVQAMGGIIGVRSVPGEGSTFWVELPVGTDAPVG